MDPRDIENLRELLEFERRMLEARITMEGMIAENNWRKECGMSIAYGEEAFNKLIPEVRISINDFPYYRG